MVSPCCSVPALFLMVISCCDLTTSYRCTRPCRHRRIQLSPLRGISHDSTDCQQSPEQTSESLQFLENETVRVFQLYMKSKADVTYYQKADVIKSANDCHNEQHLLKEANLGYFYANEDCFLRDVMTAEDHDNYEKWFAIRAKMKIGELSRRIESRSATPYSVPSKHLITSKPVSAPPVVFSKPYSIPSYLKVGNICEIDPVLGI